MTLLPVTTVQRVKTRMGSYDPTDDDGSLDDLIGDLIDAVSKAIEDFIALPLLIESRAEVYDVPPFTSELWLRSYRGPLMPAPTISSVKIRTSWKTAWADVDAEDAADYALAGEQAGLLLFASALPQGRDNVQVVYLPGFAGPVGSGGMAAVTTAFVSAFPAIADAADTQIVHELNRRKEPGQSTLALPGGGARTEQEVRLLSGVKDRLAPYRRLVL